MAERPAGPVEGPPVAGGQAGEMTRQPLWPPNPKELERIGPGSHGRAAPATMSRWISGSGCS